MNIGGIVIPIVTPLQDEGKLDRVGTCRLAEYLLASGIDGIFVAGTTGEYPRLTDKMRWDSFEAVAQAVAGRALVYAGISAAGLEATQMHARVAAESGADFLVASLPYYFPITDTVEATTYFLEIADTCEKPLMLYNIPGNVGSVIPLSAVRKLATHHRIVGIKDSGSDLEYFKELLEINKEHPSFKVFAGNEAMLMKVLPLGAHGAVPSLANVFPNLFVELWHYAQNENWPEVSRICLKITKINQLNDLCQGTSLGHIRWKKFALSLLRICSSQTTKPYIPLTREQGVQVEKILKKYGGEELAMDQ